MSYPQIYEFYEMQKKALQPISDFSHYAARMFSDPHNPFCHNPWTRRIAATYELVYRLGKDYEKPPWYLDQVVCAGKTVDITIETTLEKPFCKFIHFAKDPDQKLAPQPKIIVFAPLSGHHATLLRDTIRTLLQDFDVYTTDWVDARMVPLSQGKFGLDDYIHYVQDFFRHFADERVFCVSVCQPTVPVLAAVSLMASQNEPCTPKAMVMMGGPIDARKSPTQVNTLATTKPISWFEDNVIYPVPACYPGHLRKVYPGFLQHAGFIALNPNRHMRSHYDFYAHLIEGDDTNAEAHRRFYDEYNAVLDMAAEYYLETIQKVFQEFALPSGTWVVAGQRVVPQEIKDVWLFTIEGELDDISGDGQTQAAHELCTSIPRHMRAHKTYQGVGHYGIFSGRRWREIIYADIRQFLLGTAK